jgi:hypothetical protein
MIMIMIIIIIIALSAVGQHSRETRLALISTSSSSSSRRLLSSSLRYIIFSHTPPRSGCRTRTRTHTFSHSFSYTHHTSIFSITTTTKEVLCVCARACFMPDFGTHRYLHGLLELLLRPLVEARAVCVYPSRHELCRLDPSLWNTKCDDHFGI